MKNNIKITALAFAMIMILLSAAGCSTSVDKTKITDYQITIQGVTVSDLEISAHGTSTLPEGSCIKTELISGNNSLDWWHGDTCADVDQGIWELKISLSDNKLQEGTEYDLRAYWQDDPTVSATFVIDISGPPRPGE